MLMKHIYNILFLFFIGFSTTAFAQNAARQCKQFCEVEKTIQEDPFLGVQVTSCKNSMSTRVVKVVEGTEAEKMGILANDYVQSINGVQMEDYKFMVDWVGNQKVGLPVTIELLRKNRQITLKGKLGFKTERTVMETVCCDETINQLELANARIFPNPSTGSTTITFDGNSDEAYNLQLVDLNGNVVIQRPIYPTGKQVTEQINFSGQPAGDYIVIIEQGGKTFERKIVFLK